MLRNIFKNTAKFSTYIIYRSSITPIQNQYRYRKNFSPEQSIGYKNILALSVLSWLGFEQSDEEKESELIMTLKRAVLCTQREEFEKAEQMLHLALRLAQQQQNKQGVLYCYDLMANLAFDQYDMTKAEKLFLAVMQMLLESGVEQDNLKMIHVSLKVARINHLLDRRDKAELGYNWCLEKIEKQQHDIDGQALYGVILDWYAQFLLDHNEVDKSLQRLKEAYDVCSKVKGKHTNQTVLLLNDLGITSWRAGDIGGAENFLNEALEISKSLDDKSHVGVIHANLGLIYLQNGLIDKAEKSCKQGWQLGKKYENTESTEQASYCLDQIKSFLEQ